MKISKLLWLIVLSNNTFQVESSKKIYRYRPENPLKSKSRSIVGNLKKPQTRTKTPFFSDKYHVFPSLPNNYHFIRLEEQRYLAVRVGNINTDGMDKEMKGWGRTKRRNQASIRISGIYSFRGTCNVFYTCR